MKWISSNILFLVTIFLLAFIPLYPKLPLFDIQHTWVYVRIEDFAVALAIFLWIYLFIRKKVTLKTPLTLPILLFWIAGGFATLHGTLLIFPLLSDVFSNVALLSFLRRIEYMFLFFIAYASIKDKKNINYVAGSLVVILLLIVAYGFGQKYLGFPAFLTMNEEFAKGVPIQLSQLSRVPSTFAGHYDLAAYLVLVIPLITSMAFGFKNWIIKFLLLISAALGFVLLFMTVSRVSFLVLFLALVMLLLLQKKKLVIISLFVLTLILLSFSPSLMQRYSSTVSEVDVLVDARTGNAIGHVKEVDAQYFRDKIVIQGITAETGTHLATSSAILPFALIPPTAQLILEPNRPNGETLPQGTSYINLPLSPVTKKTHQYFHQQSEIPVGTTSAEVNVFYGDFVIKRAKAYDLSLTTRSQGEWPRTLTAFARNVFLGSGYGSVSLAVDNDYLRLLGETGLVGFFFFISVFIVAGIYIKNILPKVDSPLTRSFILGFVAGSFGLALNAILIDVFEASKIAFSYWLLMGITLGILKLYQTVTIDLFKEFKKVITSTYACTLYLFIAAFALFASIGSYYFVGDDFTWLRWAADCGQNCGSLSIFSYFTNAHGFFYRPGTKMYFDIMYSTFWLNQTPYHMVSIFLYFLSSFFIFLIAKRIFKDHFMAALTSGIFLILSTHAETVIWVSATGHLFSAVFAFLSILLFIYWKERKKLIFFVLCVISLILSLLFYEVGVVVPLLIILYDRVFSDKNNQSALSRKVYTMILFSPLIPYLIIRFMAQSHWFNGDYSYNLIKLPFNMVGNVLGYFLLNLIGPFSLTLYEKIRDFSRDNIVISFLGVIIVLVVIVGIYRFIVKNSGGHEKKIIIFGILFFLIGLLPFLGFGNITPRYGFLSSFGFALLMVVFFQKAYSYLRPNGTPIALASITVIGIIFCSVQLFQLQKVSTDWLAAGEKSKRFLISLDEVYDDNWAKDPMQLYFVGTPLKNGDAWIFPVGLQDAVWFAFENKNIKVYQASSLDTAFDLAGVSPTSRVFQFNDDGSLTSMIKTKDGIIVPFQ